VEALIHQKGADNLVRPDDSLRLAHIQVAGLVHLDQVQLGPAERNALYVIGGPSLSFKVHSDYSAPGVIADIADEVRNVDFGFIAGGGLE